MLWHQLRDLRGSYCHDEERRQDAHRGCEELVPEMKVVSDNVFVKTKSNALTSEAFSAFIAANDINEFYVAGADATACVKSTCFNMAKAGFTVHVLSDCITSYDLKKLPEMLAYYESKGCEVKKRIEYK